MKKSNSNSSTSTSSSVTSKNVVGTQRPSDRRVKTNVVVL